MSVNYHDVLAQIALRVNAIVGVAAATLETSYTTRPLTTTQFQSAAFPFTSFKDALQAAEERFAQAIASRRDHPWRAFLAGVTSNLAHKAAFPSSDSLGRSIVGVPGAIYDSSDGIDLVERPLAEVRLRVRNSNSFFKGAAYSYAWDSIRLNHTRTNVIIAVCAYDRGTQRTAISANSAMLLPDVLEQALYSDGVSRLVRDDLFMAQAARYGRHADRVEAAILGGKVEMPPLEEGA